MIALWHLAGGARPANVADFVDPVLLPEEPCAVATVVGDQLDALNGLIDRSTGVSTWTLWGEVARQLGPCVWSRFERSDRERTPPGKQLWMDAFEQRPTLIVIDELALHLTQLASSQNPDVRRQEEATIQALKVLFEAATAAPAVRLIFTLATGTAAFSDHTSKLVEAISSVSVEGASQAAHDVMARSKGGVGRPADDYEIGHILRRRLFEHVDDGVAEQALAAFKDFYAELAPREPQSLGAAGEDPASYCERIRTCYPFHPALIDCLDKRIGPLPGFQRARGALKLLAESLAVLWNEPAAQRTPLPVINLGDLPLGAEAVRACITGGINRAELDPPALADFAGEASHAVAVDSARWPEQRPARRACATVFCHSVAGESHGAAAADVCLGALRPHEDPALLDEALGEALKVAWHLHFDGGRWRFRVEPNANKIVASELANVSQSEVTDELEAKVRTLFSSSGSLRAVHFPVAPGDIADAPRLQLVVLSPAEAVESGASAPSRLVRRIADRSGGAESLRTFRNGLVFAVPEKAYVSAAREKISFELAAKRVVARQQKGDFSAAVVKKLKELAATAELESRMALSRAYQHVWWPERAGSSFACCPSLRPTRARPAAPRPSASSSSCATTPRSATPNRPPTHWPVRRGSTREGRSRLRRWHSRRGATRLRLSFSIRRSSSRRLPRACATAPGSATTQRPAPCSPVRSRTAKCGSRRTSSCTRSSGPRNSAFCPSRRSPPARPLVEPVARPMSTRTAQAAATTAARVHRGLWRSTAARRTHCRSSTTPYAILGRGTCRRSRRASLLKPARECSRSGFSGCALANSPVSRWG